MLILVNNVGSTSLKFKLYSMPEEKVLCESKIERIGSEKGSYLFQNCLSLYKNSIPNIPIESYSKGIDLFLANLTDKENGVIDSVNQIDGLGFKTVISKGYDGTVLLTDDVMQGMKDYLFIAPIHNKAYIDAIEQFKLILPNIPMIGVFETSFHQTIPLENKLYSLPYEWYQEYGIARKGYHGASFSYVAKQARKDNDYKYIIGCHLGGSSSICAIKDGKSFDSSFGFSLQTGLPHANRSGDADSYIVPFLQNEGLSWQEIRQGLDNRGGMLGISGVSNDFIEIQQAIEVGNERAKLAVDVFVVSIVRYIGAFSAEMGGLDKIVFTGGIGENSAMIRKKVCDKLEHLSVKLDNFLNQQVPEDGYISSKDSKVKVQVIKANEELGIARETYNFLKDHNE